MARGHANLRKSDLAIKTANGDEPGVPISGTRLSDWL